MKKVEYEFGQWFVFSRGKRISKPFGSYQEAVKHMESL